jgi:DNA replication and repair protein RecF
VRLRRLWLTNFRNYASAEIDLAEHLTVVVGPNGQGKSNLVEAIGYLATLGSFRGAAVDALIRHGYDCAVVRAEGERDGRSLLIEAEINRTGRNRVLVNRQRLPRARDLLDALQVVVFAPDDLSLVKGGPAERRAYLDDLLVALQPRHDVLRTELDRVLRQRNALLKQAGGHLVDDIAITLDVWDAKLASIGEDLVAARLATLERLEPVLASVYEQLGGSTSAVGKITLSYYAPWRDLGLAGALAAARKDDVRRGVTTVGPHRDDIVLTIEGLPSRTHASQGEQRCLALALRLAAHHLITAAIGSPPVLLLDDVFSELDSARSAALLAQLPAAQTILTTASAPPAGTKPELVIEVCAGVATPR